MRSGCKTSLYVRKASYDEPDIVSEGQGRHQKLQTDPPPDFILTNVDRRRKGDYTGLSTRGIHCLKQQGGLLPLNPYVRFDYWQDSPTSRWGGRNRCSNGVDNWDFTWPQAMPPLHSADTMNKVTAAMSQMGQSINLVALQQSAFADTLGAWDIGTEMAEIHKTVDMLVNVRQRAAKLILQARRKGWHTAKAAASGWLEFRYGWRPLWYSLHDAVDAYNTPVRDRILQGRSGQAVQEVVSFPRVFDSYHVTADVKEEVYRDLSIRCNAHVDMSVRTDNLLFSPPLTLWEVVPFSFVVDWFITVGDAIGAWWATAFAKEYASSFGYKYTEDVHVSTTGIRLGTGSCAAAPIFGSSYGSSHTLAKVRTGAGAPSFVPQLKVKLDSAKIADAAALLVKPIFKVNRALKNKRRT